MMRLNPYRIGFRTIKTAVGMALGIIIAKLMGLDNFASSAILVVLCIKHTKVHSLQAIISRFVSCILILIIGSIAFSYFGQNAIILGLIVLFFIPLTVVFKVQEGVVTSCVILLHVFNAEVIDMHLFINEILLLIVGLGIAFIMNLIMPSLDFKLKQYKEEIENQFTTIFEIFSNNCKEPNASLNISFNQLQLTIQKAKSIAFRDVKNHFVRNENSYYHYFDMREEQLELLERMSKMIQNIETKDMLLTKISSLFLEVAHNVNSNDYTVLRLHSLYEIKIELEQLELPKTHASFRTRASIKQLLNELEEYLEVKSQFGSLKLHKDTKSTIFS
ncbi:MULTISPECIES: aromatic acid exporter family protein [Staphylococcus]|uniref:aromatic acid exporter family protein n=1 Tax=Staphylococcus TaxID=1279 RepID=UPI0015E5FF19|nr:MULTISPECIES: aromatic acid exporter family protein [Staphylococcus]MBA1354271.1 aromatic acid exporter family protein [Staphylococcus cohnii]MBA1391473.1 aromatic acid exporter family protein [Staphylococcus cohnii]